MQDDVMTPIDSAASHDALMRFLHAAPLGLLQAGLDGTIETINATAATLLAPLSSNGRLDNLFALLIEAMPQLQAMVAAFDRDTGTVCESVRIPMAGRANSAVSQIPCLGVFKLDATRLLATVSDVVVEPVNHERASRRSVMAAELRHALAENKLFVQYQPIVGLRHENAGFGVMDRSAGVEALVRWNHRIRGAVSPLEFISVAEEYGLIGALGDFVLNTACRQFMKWQLELGVRAPRLLALNLSRVQIAQPGFVASVGNIVNASGMPAEQLQLEVNESVVAQDEAVQARLRELKALGLVLALDHFGTGYSSLTRLHQLPVDVIKIDRSFVNEAIASSHHRVLIESMVRVAKSLRMSTVAEGIETEAQLAMVRQSGCEKGQGFFFSEAISAANLEQWLSLD
jgi:EAL domain-containing protein (putative c-di-GMP-specific phosphodiesterase class I)